MSSFRFRYIFNPKADIDDRLDYIYDILDDWMIAGNFDKCDEVLQTIYDKHLNMTSRHLDIFMGLLTITLPSKDKLKNRASFVKAIHDKLLVQEGKEHTDALMSGLL